MNKLDELLASQQAPRPGDAVKAALLAELKLPPKRSWRGDVLLVIAACWGTAAVAAAALLALGQLQPTQLAARAGPILAVLAIGAWAAFAALAPRRTALRRSAFALAGLGLVGLVLARGAGTPGTSPEWICTVSHLAVGAGPLALALSLLRKSAIDPFRATLLGLAVGTTGAAVGELACRQSWAHVAIFHLGAWLALAIAAALLSRRMLSKSFAP